MNANVRRGWLLALIMLAVLAPGQALAGGPYLDSLYEVTENASLRLKKKSGTRSATASLFGQLSLSAPICPPGLTECFAVVIASDDLDVNTGEGPITGDVFIVAPFPSDNPVDAPEGTVAEGSLRGKIQLAPPLGSIEGSWEVKGAKGSGFEKFKAKGPFKGTFYLPFIDPNIPGCAQTPCYLIDGIPTPVTPGEYSLGFPTVRLAIGFDRSSRGPR
jgi:hypothetical protein